MQAFLTLLLRQQGDAQAYFSPREPDILMGILNITGGKQNRIEETLAQLYCSDQEGRKQLRAVLP
jgi:hypothetical protein